MSLLLPHRIPTILSFLYPPWATLLPRFTCRHESSSRRTTKKLRTKPNVSSLTASVSPDNVNDYIVFNPPSSAPSPYHTPAAFLPRDDPRRDLLSQSHLHSNPYVDLRRSLPPLARKTQKQKKYHLTPKQIEEIRELRTKDPWKWTRKRLAERFDCSQFFVGIVAEAPTERKRSEMAKLEAVKERWGWRRRNAREERGKRQELWGMDK
ncbi:uncharacterized protein KY384_006072 [Bacidia gigantensis]|uniref:uncharacterized protein n=1 Tax=Bacidia gigantensis TaxID=2732470 RepID=UPI001D0517CB|nr:uncharacterized protein KY384_006072 [Bacidia gigantensis]KAG8529435.1 hypothetical protein KY384_006072 [Bacidia gigantensis]